MLAGNPVFLADDFVGDAAVARRVPRQRAGQIRHIADRRPQILDRPGFDAAQALLGGGIVLYDPEDLHAAVRGLVCRHGGPRHHVSGLVQLLGNELALCIKSQLGHLRRNFYELRLCLLKHAARDQRVQFVKWPLVFFALIVDLLFNRRNFRVVGIGVFRVVQLPSCLTQIHFLQRKLGKLEVILKELHFRNEEAASTSVGRGGNLVAALRTLHVQRGAAGGALGLNGLFAGSELGRRLTRGAAYVDQRLHLFVGISCQAGLMIIKRQRQVIIRKIPLDRSDTALSEETVLLEVLRRGFQKREEILQLGPLKGFIVFSAIGLRIEDLPASGVEKIGQQMSGAAHVAGKLHGAGFHNAV